MTPKTHAPLPNPAPLGAGALIWAECYQRAYNRPMWTGNVPLPREVIEGWSCTLLTAKASRPYYAAIDNIAPRPAAPTMQRAA